MRQHGPRSFCVQKSKMPPQELIPAEAFFTSIVMNVFQ